MINTTDKFLLVHSFEDDPVIEKIKDVHVVKGQAYIVPPQTAYTISRTDEQQKAYIESLEERLRIADYKLSCIISALYPNDESDIHCTN